MIGVDPNFEMMLMKLEKGVSHRSTRYRGSRKRTIRGLLLVDVVRGLAVAVVVEVDLDQRLRVLAQAPEHTHDDGLLLQRRRLHLEDRNENLVEKHFNLFLHDVTQLR